MGYLDPLGDRMKQSYEKPFRHQLPKRSFVIIRLDGRAFSSYTAKLEKPYDLNLMTDLGSSLLALAKEASNCIFGTAHSDEMSILLSDWDKESLEKEPWFGNDQSKIETISTSLVTGEFLKRRIQLSGDDRLAQFDARAFTITLPHEVHNYFIWRQFDCARNAVQAVAQKLFSQTQLNNKSIAEMRALISDKGHPIEQYPAAFKLGQMVFKDPITNKWVLQPASDFKIKGNPAPLVNFLENV